MPPDGLSPTTLLNQACGVDRVGCLGGPAHAREMVTEGAGLVAASTNVRLAAAVASVFMRAGVVCEQSNDPVGVELSGVAKNAAALAAGATEAQGLNAAGAAAGHIFAEVWRYAERQGGKPESMIGLAGHAATSSAPRSRRSRATAARASCSARACRRREIPARIGQAVEALDMVPLLATRAAPRARRRPVTTALQRPDLRRAAAGRVGRAGARHRPAARGAPPSGAARGPDAPPRRHRVAQAPGLTHRPLSPAETAVAGSSSTNSAPPPGALAARTTAAVLLGDLAHDRQPEPRARPPARRRAAVEAVEQVREVLGLDRRCRGRARARRPASARTSTTPPGGECLAALSSRLLTARASRSRVPSTTAGSSRASKRDRPARAGAPASALARRGRRAGRPRVSRRGSSPRASSIRSATSIPSSVVCSSTSASSRARSSGGSASASASTSMLVRRLGDRRAQLVRGVGDELALGGDRALERVEHRVEVLRPARRPRPGSRPRSAARGPRWRRCGARPR